MIILREGGYGGKGGARGEGVAHGDIALQRRVIGEILKRLRNGYALCCPLIHHLGVIGKHHVANADRIPVAFLIIGEAEQGVSTLYFYGLKIARFLQLQGEGWLGNQHHVAAEHSGLHLPVDLGDQRRCAAVEEEAAVIGGRQIGKLFFNGFVHHVDDKLIHGGINPDGALHVLINCRSTDGKSAGQHNRCKNKCEYFFHFAFLHSKSCEIIPYQFLPCKNSLYRESAF